MTPVKREKKRPIADSSPMFFFVYEMMPSGPKNLS